MGHVTSQESLAAGGKLADLPPTRWSVVARAGNRDGEAWTTALGELVTAYRPVLLRHLVANMRLPPDRAEDLVGLPGRQTPGPQRPAAGRPREGALPLLFAQGLR